MWFRDGRSGNAGDDVFLSPFSTQLVLVLVSKRLPRQRKILPRLGPLRKNVYHSENRFALLTVLVRAASRAWHNHLEWSIESMGLGRRELPRIDSRNVLRKPTLGRLWFCSTR